MEHNIELRPVMETIQVKVIGAKKAAFRLRLASPIFRLACWVAGIKNIKTEIE